MLWVPGAKTAESSPSLTIQAEVGPPIPCGSHSRRPLRPHEALGLEHWVAVFLPLTEAGLPLPGGGGGPCHPQPHHQPPGGMCFLSAGGVCVGGERGRARLREPCRHRDTCRLGVGNGPGLVFWNLQLESTPCWFIFKRLFKGINDSGHGGGYGEDLLYDPSWVRHRVRRELG